MLKPGDTIQCPITGERLVIRANGAQPRDDSPTKRILVATMPIPGHVRPGLAIVRELTRRGHEVSWYTGRAFESAVQRAGATFVPIPSHLEPGSELWATSAKGQPASGLRKLRWDIRHGFLGTVPAYLRHLRNVFDDTQPDVVVAEQGFVAAPLLAEQRDIPRVIFTVTPLSLSSEDTAPFGTGLPPATTALGRLRNRALTGLLRNLVFRDSQRFAAGLRSDLRLAPLDGSFLDWGANIADRYLHATIPEFEYPRGDLPDHVEFIGALLPTDVDDWSPPPWWDDLAQAHRAGRRVVLVTQGTVATDPGNLLLPTIRALAKDDVLLVATTGGADPDFVLPRTQRPGNLRLDTFVPFTQLLPHVDAVVTNGGYGGVQTALAHGVPLVAAGRSEDKMEVSARVAWSGAGISLGTDTPTEDRIGDAVHTVLTVPSYRETARRLRDGYSRYDAAGRGAEIILGAAHRRSATRVRRRVPGPNVLSPSS